MESSRGVDHPVEGSTATLGSIYPELKAEKAARVAIKVSLTKETVLWLQMHCGLQTSLVQTLNECESDVANLSCCS